MKRTLLQRGAIIAACAAAFVFAACGDDPEFDARTDTVYSLETPSVTAKAYPGVNVVSWKPVTGAQGYKVSVYEEGAFKRDIPLYDSNKYQNDYFSGNCYIDTKLTNGKNYTYYVEAVSDSEPAGIAREVYVKNSRGEASVKAIVPPYGTESLDLAAYEGGYDGKTVKTVPENEKFSAKDITVTQDNDGYVYVSFPMKAYLSYTVNYYNNNLNSLEPDSNVMPTGSRSVIPDPNANNALGQAAFPITNAGTYQIAVVASATNRNYVTSKEVPYGTITIKKLELDDQTRNLSAEYITSDYKFVTGADKTARISFTPAMKNGEYVPNDWYKVYRRVAGEYENTKIAEGTAVAKSTDTTNDTKYYVDDKDLDVNKDYVYTVVVTDGTKYGSSYTVNLSRKTKLDITGLVPSATFNYTTNKITLGVQVSGIAASVTPATAKYLVVPTDRITPVLAQEILEGGTAVTLSVVADSDPKTYQTEISPPNFTGDDAYVYLVVQATLDGYNTTNVIDSAQIYK